MFFVHLCDYETRRSISIKEKEKELNVHEDFIKTEKEKIKHVNKLNEESYDNYIFNKNFVNKFQEQKNIEVLSESDEYILYQLDLSSDEDEDGMIRNSNSGSGSSNKSSQVVNGVNGEAKISVSPKKSKKGKSSIKIEIIPGGDQPKVINLEVRSSSDSSVQEVKETEKPIRQITKVQVTTTTAAAEVPA
jgi:hypothetical protein